MKANYVNVIRGLLKSFFGSIEEAGTGQTEEKKEYEQLIEGVKSACNEWSVASMNFDSAETIDLIDYYTYRIKAAEIKIDYYLKKIKQKQTDTDLASA